MNTPHSYFESLFADSDDPWAYRERWYEARKRAMLLAALPRAHYEHIFEPGCANGELTALLAARCTRLTACDLSAAAVRIARARNAATPHVEVQHLALPDAWPAGEFDLIVVSEFGYYLGEAGVAGLATRLQRSLSRHGTLVACHWRHRFNEARSTAEQVHRTLAEVEGLSPIASHVEADFLLDVWSRDARSVAQVEGIA